MSETNTKDITAAEYLGVSRVYEVKKKLEATAKELEKEPFDKCEIKSMKPHLLASNEAQAVILELLCFLIKSKNTIYPKSVREFLYMLALKAPMAFVAFVALYILGVMLNVF
jgi:hypothetical protein